MQMKLKKYKSKIIIIGFVVVLVLIAIGFKKTFSSITTSTKSLEKTKERIESYYDKEPMIALVTSNTDSITISAGYYRYSDVVKDGEIDEYDSYALESYLDNTSELDENSIILADINGDGLVNKLDLLTLQDYIKEKTSVKYDTKPNSVYYCLSTKKDSSSCTWQSSNSFKITKKGTYYIFAKDKSTKTISTPKEYVHEKIDYSEIEE